ncbi:MAG TPA: D-alanyl-D-alanine carboxypeptidase family protein, partial [Brevundimonas sp.]
MPKTASLRRGLVALLTLCVLALVPTPGVMAPVAQSDDNARYAAIVVDAASGEVLFARHADARRYPASITKVMTMYMAFDALSEGKVRLDDVLTISPRAASQPPSKLGLAAGQTITLDDALKAMAVRSCNDMAVAVAEHVGGSEARFAAMMTLKAQDLGMSQTRYVNANGLPDSRQLTSARDLAILSRAVMRDFPQYYRYFGLHDWNYGGREYRSTNGLLNSGQGYDGIKTGFTNASRYNLAASAVRDGRRLITIVLGGRTVASRNAHVAALMDVGFEVERRRAGGERIQVAQAIFEERGFGIGADNAGPVQYASLADTEDEPGTAGVTLTSGPSAARPTTVEPAPSQRADLPADVTAILNGGTAPA